MAKTLIGGMTTLKKYSNEDFGYLVGKRGISRLFQRGAAVHYQFEAGSGINSSPLKRASLQKGLLTGVTRKGTQFEAILCEEGELLGKLGGNPVLGILTGYLWKQDKVSSEYEGLGDYRLDITESDEGLDVYLTEPNGRFSVTHTEKVEFTYDTPLYRDDGTIALYNVVQLETTNSVYTLVLS